MLTFFLQVLLKRFLKATCDVSMTTVLYYTDYVIKVNIQKDIQTKYSQNDFFNTKMIIQ